MKFAEKSSNRRDWRRLPQEGQAQTFELTGSSEKFQRTFENELDSIRAALAEQLATLAGPAGSHPVKALSAAGQG